MAHLHHLWDVCLQYEKIPMDVLLKRDCWSPGSFWLREVGKGSQEVGEGPNPEKAHLHPLRDVCVQYESISIARVSEICTRNTIVSIQIIFAERIR